MGKLDETTKTNTHSQHPIFRRETATERACKLHARIFSPLCEYFIPSHEPGLLKKETGMVVHALEAFVKY
jgi:hypothetical protein